MSIDQCSRLTLFFGCPVGQPNTKSWFPVFGLVAQTIHNLRIKMSQFWIEVKTNELCFLRLFHSVYHILYGPVNPVTICL